jgi:RNA polymerase sigma-70 factor (ECF subfamily)
LGTRQETQERSPTTETTTRSLLERLRQRDAHEAWQRFVELYTPLLQFWARRLGLRAPDVDDLVQEVFRTLLQKLPALELRPGGTFRGWLRVVTRNMWCNLRRQRVLPQVDSAVLQEVHDAAEQFWEVDFRRYLVKRALDVMQADFQPTTWKACWEVVAHGRAASEVARELGLTVGAVHAARARVLARLREEMGPMMD